MVRCPGQERSQGETSGRGHRNPPPQDDMKKFLFACLLTLPLTTAARQEASAWCKFNIGVGANLGLQSGGSKSFLWGLYQSSDVGAIPPQLAGFPSGYSANVYGGYGGYGGGLGATQLGPSGQDF